MDKEQSVIKEKMEDTRVHLTDQIEKLEETIKETVQGTLGAATNVVQDVEETVETVKDTVQKSAEAVKDTVQATVSTVKGAVRDAFDVSGHAQRHPWLMLGGAVALGFLGGRLLSRPRAEARGWRDRRQGRAEAFGDGLDKLKGVNLHEPSPAPQVQAEEKGPSLVGKIGETFGSELAKLKGLALGAAFGVLRDMIAGSSPEQFKSQLTDVINNVTSKLGGQVIQGPLIDTTRRDEAPPAGGSGETGGAQGGAYEAQRAGLGRPAGAAYRPGQPARR